jgi:peptidyl-prolyl cis-trans isomerase B (cyclophilin B)
MLARSMRRSILLLALLVLALLVAGCGGDDSSTSTAADTAAATSDTTAAAASGLPQGCHEAQAAAPKDVKESKPTKKLGAGDHVVKMTTNCGEIDIQLNTKQQPKTAASFAHLVQDGVYDGLTFHRIVPGFVIQGGDPAGNGQGGPGYSVTEKPPADAGYTRGVVAMAKTAVEKPGTSGSQFFIVLPPDAQLPADYALVGTVVGDGMDVVDRIATVPTDAQDAPTVPIVIEKATLAS